MQADRLQSATSGSEVYEVSMRRSRRTCFSSNSTESREASLSAKKREMTSSETAFLTLFSKIRERATLEHADNVVQAGLGDVGAPLHFDGSCKTRVAEVERV